MRKYLLSMMSIMMMAMVGVSLVGCGVVMPHCLW